MGIRFWILAVVNVIFPAVMGLVEGFVRNCELDLG